MMSIKRSLYLLAVYFATFYGIQAIQPAGYLGCFRDNNGDSLINSSLMYVDQINNDGDYCKSTCKSKLKRYAGTKGWKCYGGDNYNKSRSSTECSQKCPGNTDEICGDPNRIIIYDTWMCITSPCENGATCNDKNADTFTCHCTEGWTGHFCNETVTSTISHTTKSSSSFAVTLLSTTSVSTTTTTGDTISTVTTTNLTTIISSTTPAATTKITKTNATATANNSKQSVNSSAQTGKNLLSIYISAPLGVIIAAIGVIAFLVIRKRQNQKKDDTSAIYNKSEEAIHTCAFSNTAYNDQDIQSDIPVYANVTAENKVNENIVGTIKESDYQYETSNPDINSEIPVDEDGYGHLKSKTTAVLFDPTYSHTTNLQNSYTHDNTYSNVDKVTEQLQSDALLNGVDDTYSHINKPAGKLKPDVNVNATDDTYSNLNKNGTKINQHDRIRNHTAIGLGEPEYDHTKLVKTTLQTEQFTLNNKQGSTYKS